MFEYRELAAAVIRFDAAGNERNNAETGFTRCMIIALPPFERRVFTWAFSLFCFLALALPDAETSVSPA